MCFILCDTFLHVKCIFSSQRDIKKAYMAPIKVIRCLQHGWLFWKSSQRTGMCLLLSPERRRLFLGAAAAEGAHGSVTCQSQWAQWDPCLVISLPRTRGWNFNLNGKLPF